MPANRIISVRNSSAVTVLFGMVLLFFIWSGLYFKVQNERQLEIDNAFKETANYARTFEEHTVLTIRGLDQIALFLKYQVEKDGKRACLSTLKSEASPDYAQKTTSQNRLQGRRNRVAGV